jgi:hypothetical protein
VFLLHNKESKSLETIGVGEAWIKNRHLLHKSRSRTIPSEFLFVAVALEILD